ncbi:MAG: type I-U CRISPR-associated protein Cas5/Cas6 [Verrucomicrobiales bacterium]|nr:type I-U CRISPR-associated protein Cas5/Cas6 [Verrucomicrobiales bacterium]
MLTIQIKLPWERYHAHPWGQNPGRVAEAEWPPSPWRLLRSLVAAWFRANTGQPASGELHGLLKTLASELPHIGVGKVAFAKTVHYQPNYKHSSSDAALATYGKTRHENLFAATAEPICFRWTNTTLDDAQTALLRTLLDNVTYFGRADSICEAEIVTAAPPAIDWCKPCLASDGSPQRRIAQTCRDVFCPNPADFRATDLWLLRANAEGGRTPHDQLTVPKHLVNQLLAADMRVDGGILVSYRMPDGWPRKWLVTAAQTTRARSSAKDISTGPKVAHYLRFSLQCRVPVGSRFAVDVANLFHKAVCKILDGFASPALTGKDISGHRHAFYLPTGDGTSLTDLHIWCPLGFTRQEMDILTRVHHLRWGKSRFEINPVLIAAAKEPPADSGLSFGKAAKVWESLTPFVPPLHFYRGSKENPKFNANASPEKQLFECLKNADLQKAVFIERITPTAQRGNWDIVRVNVANETASGFANGVSATVHQNSSTPGNVREIRRVGFFFRLTFDEPVPLSRPALGHSSHFGLGLFVPVS